MLRLVRAEELDSASREDRRGAEELAARARRLEDDVQAVVAALRDRITVRGNLGAVGIAKEIAVEGDGNRRGHEQHLVVAGVLAAAAPSEGVASIVAQRGNHCSLEWLRRVRRR